MKATELIEILQDTIEIHGDIDVQHSLGAFGEKALNADELTIEFHYIGGGVYANTLDISHPMWAEVKRMEDARAQV